MSRLPRLFVAVWPPDEIVADLSALRRKDQRGVRFHPPENWHITLRFLGDTEPDAVGEALDRATFAPCTARLGPGIDVLNERSLVVPVGGVDQLAAEVVAHTGSLGEAARKRFVGHITLAKVAPRQPMPPVLGSLFQAEFEVDEVALVQSTLHPDGARYQTIGSWPVA